MKDLGREFSKHFPGVNIADKGAWGGITTPRDEEKALAGFTPFLEEIMPEAPPARRRELADYMDDTILQNCRIFESYYAAGYALQAGRAAVAPNSTASLMPIFATGTSVGIPGTSYPLYVSQGGVVQSGQPFVFVKRMTFHRIMTAKIDADAGWFFVGNTVKFQDDPIAGIFYDTSFTAFEPEIPFDRTPLGAYERRTFRQDAVIQFNASAFINPNSPAAEMVTGLILQYRDDRCNVMEDVLEGLPNGNSLVEVVHHLIGQRVASHGGYTGRRPSGGDRPLLPPR